MTSLVDVNDETDLNGLEKDLSDAIQTKPDPTPEDKTSDNVEDGLPEKYRGKTAAQIAEMHANLESAYGRMANDLGTQRKLTDQLLELKRTDDLADNSAAPAKVTPEDLLNDPEAALERYFSTRKTEDKSEERLNQLETSLAQKEFATKHPDSTKIVNDADFIDWVKQSRFRMQAAQVAAGGDYSAADDLLTEYKQVRKANLNTDDNEDDPKPTPTERAKTLATERSGGSSTKTAGKVYSRTSLQRLKIEKPHVYEDPAFQEEILKAYQEGRVK